MLAGGRLVNEERRQLYYEAMATDGSRLQHLVEELPNFGRIETVAMRYRRDPVGAAEVVRSAIAGFERQCEDSRVGLSVPEHHVPCRATGMRCRWRFGIARQRIQLLPSAQRCGWR
jgi:K+-sensing histidine kinase KdpD